MFTGIILSQILTKEFVRIGGGWNSSCLLPMPGFGIEGVEFLNSTTSLYAFTSCTSANKSKRTSILNIIPAP
jgi:hypothetical protein